MKNFTRIWQFYCSTCGEIGIHQLVWSGGMPVLRCMGCRAEQTSQTIESLFLNEVA